MARFTALIFLATLAYTFVSAWTLLELRKSNELEHRAWVLADQITLVRPPVTPGKFLLTVHEKNRGKSPASDVTTYAGHAVRRVNPRFVNSVDFNVAELVQSRMLAGPDNAYPSKFDIEVTASEVEELKNGATFYVAGKIVYVDPYVGGISQPTRETRFCAYWDGRGEMITCRVGNSAK